MKPKQKIRLTKEYQNIETLKDFEIPYYLKGKFRAVIVNEEVETIYTINDNGFNAKTITDISKISSWAQHYYKLCNIEELNYFNYTNEEHQKAGTNVKIIDLKVARNTPEYDGSQDENSISISGTFFKDGFSHYVWIYMGVTSNGEGYIEYRKKAKYGYYDAYTTGTLYPIK